MRLSGSTALARRMASGTVQPGPQSSARPTLSPVTSFMASIQAMVCAMPRSVSRPRFGMPPNRLDLAQEVVGHLTRHLAVKADALLDDGEVLLGLHHLGHVLGEVLRLDPAMGKRTEPL